MRNSHTLTKTIVMKIDESREAILRSLFFAIVLTAVLYAYFLNGTIRDVVFVSDNQKTMTELRSSLGVLENQYLSEESKITLSSAESRGFVDASDPIYIKQSPSATLSLNTIK